MRRAGVLALAVTLLSACDNNVYKVTCDVSAENIDNDTLYLENYDKSVASDSRTDTACVTDGKVVFEGTIDGSEIRRLNVNGKIVNFIVEPGEITIDLNKGLAEGTPLNDDMSNYMESLVDLTDKYAKEWDNISQQTDITRDERSELLAQIMRDAHVEEYTLAKKVVELHRDDALGQWAFWNGIAGNAGVTFEKYKKELVLAGSKIAGYAPIARETQRLQAQEKTSIGKVFSDVTFAAGGADMADVSLSDYFKGGELYLVFVWAYWSEPCLQSIDIVESLHKRYSEKGLKTLSVSVGDEPTRAEELLNARRVTFDRVNDKEMSILSTYGVVNVPYLMLIDKDGKIVSRGISPSALGHWLRTELSADEEK